MATRTTTQLERDHVAKSRAWARLTKRADARGITPEQLQAIEYRTSPARLAYMRATHSRP